MKLLSERIFDFILSIKAAAYIINTGKRLDLDVVKSKVAEKVQSPIKPSPAVRVK